MNKRFLFVFNRIPANKCEMNEKNFNRHSLITNKITKSGNNHQHMKPLGKKWIGT